MSIPQMTEHAIKEANRHGEAIRDRLKIMANNPTIVAILNHLSPEEPPAVFAAWEEVYTGESPEEHLALVYHQWQMLAVFVGDLQEDTDMDLVQMLFDRNTVNFCELIRSNLATMTFLVQGM